MGESPGQKANRKARERDAKKNAKRDMSKSPGRGGRAPRKCGRCSGTGTVTKWVTPRIGAKFKIDNTCPDCGGRGETT